MPDRKIKAEIINESNTNVERLAARITSLPNNGGTFLKTCAMLHDRSNHQVAKKLEDELIAGASKGFLGIGVVSYSNISYIEFYSAFRSFPLNKGDQVTLVFENSKEMKFEFKANNKDNGYVKRNNCFADDTLLQYMADTRLHYWILINAELALSVKGGFECNEYNQQYRSRKGGQILLQNMVKEILAIKPLLLTA